MTHWNECATPLSDATALPERRRGDRRARLSDRDESGTHPVPDTPALPERRRAERRARLAGWNESEDLRPADRRSWYRAWSAIRGEVECLHPRLLVAELLARLLPPLAFQRVRTALYRLGGVSIGARTRLAGRLELIGPGPIASHLVIGSDCWFNAPVFADLTGSLSIGNHVNVGHHVVFITARHSIGPPGRRAGSVEAQAIVVEAGAWIGAGVLVLPGARIGSGSVVGAGSLVIGDVPPNVVVVGRPARVLRTL